MARPKPTIPLEQKPIRLFAGDFAKLQVLFPKLGATAAIRTLVHSFITRVEGTARPLEIDLPDAVLADLTEEERANG